MIETIDTLSYAQVQEITTWFNKEVGTDYEVNESASGIPGEYYILFCDLEGDEWGQVMTYLKDNGIEFY